MTALESDGDGRERVWNVVSDDDAYLGYQKMTLPRVIPVFVLAEQAAGGRSEAPGCLSAVRVYAPYKPKAIRLVAEVFDGCSSGSVSIGLKATPMLTGDDFEGATVPDVALIRQRARLE